MYKVLQHPDLKARQSGGGSQTLGTVGAGFRLTLTKIRDVPGRGSVELPQISRAHYDHLLYLFIPCFLERKINIETADHRYRSRC